MSLGSFFKTVGTDILKGVGVVAPIAGVIASFTPVGSVASTVFNSIVAVEQLVSTSSSGPAKKAAVTSIVNAVHPGLNQTDISNTIDAVVAALNNLGSVLAKTPVAVTS